MPVTSFNPPLSVLGHFSCGTGLHLSAECCGKKFDTRTSSFDVALFIAKFSIPWQNALLDPPEEVAPKCESDIADARENSLQWGVVVDWTTHGSGHQIPSTVRASRFGFKVTRAVTDSTELDDTRIRVLSELDAWWTLFSSWVAVLTEQDPRDYWRAVEATRMEPIWTWVDGEPKRRAQTVSADWPQHRDTDALDQTTLMVCMSLAGSGQPPPDEWIFIRDARSALRAGDYRRAIIDAGTAAELAITELLDQDLALVDPAIREALFKRARALEGRSNLMKDLKAGTEPPGFTAGLKTPRNDAAHKGHRSSKQVAVKAIEVAVELVEQATPLLSLIPPV
ncbi:hypothetical protein ACIHDR_43085 [Nocardia sp. NPDC052278]|uniref:hypothetical protein n=1 Tax=unclassified Nocardia TaxID=2637762 RepID=UPI0036906561